MPDSDPQLSEDAPQVLAFYLPQFHQVPENDAWHGTGFTEWSVVAESKPLYPGHRQPDLPGELGFYDLRVPETRYRQARLAKEHGITGFLYYHYWFAGRRMLDRPFREVLGSGQPDFPFALCWANESWYRRWQGTLDEMILEQRFSEEDDIAHIRWLITCFEDPRYIRVQGRPLLAIYRPDNLPDARRTVELWRRECDAAGMEPPWLVMFETGEELNDPASLHFDASAEFVPHHLPQLIGHEPYRFGNENSHRMYGYEQVASAYLDRPHVPWQRYPCVPTAWDNAPRRQNGEALILHGSTPERYGHWLDEAVARQSRSAGRDGVVFINAWNEWAEGAHLEPDALWGRAYLESTREVLRARFGEALDVTDVVEPVHPQPVASEELYHDLYEQFVELQKTASGILSFAERRVRELKKHYESRLGWTRHETGGLLDLNEWLVEQLDLQSDRLRALGVEDAIPTHWLTARSAKPSAGKRPDPDADFVGGSHAGSDGGADLSVDVDGLDRSFEKADDDHPGEKESSEKELTEEELAAGLEEDLRRDDGFDDPPGERTPLWMMDV